MRCIAESSTLYVGNLSFYTSEEQIHALFSKIGQIKRIIMGLDRNQKTPCGFCFVEYYTRENALACKRYLDGMKLDERYIRVDLDPGFREGRQFGRGRRGGQVGSARLYNLFNAIRSVMSFDVAMMQAVVAGAVLRVRSLMAIVVCTMVVRPITANATGEILINLLCNDTISIHTNMYSPYSRCIAIL